MFSRAVYQPTSPYGFNFKFGYFCIRNFFICGCLKFKMWNLKNLFWSNCLPIWYCGFAKGFQKISASM
jgi:hypothetical protein